MTVDGAWVRVEGPDTEVLSLDDAKEHLRVEGDEENALISAYVQAARQWCEEFTSRALVTQTWELQRSSWPEEREIRLPRPPLQSVTWVKYTDENGVQNTLDPSTYRVVTASEPGRILLAPNASWPTVPLDTGLPITVRFVAGYGNSYTQPPAIVQAVRFLTGHFYENRESVVIGSFQPLHVPDTVRALLWPWRVW